MNILICYATSHGSSETIAIGIAEKLMPLETSLVNLKEKPAPDLSQADAVVVGGSIHAGAIQPEITRFLSVHKTELLKRPLALFMCGMNEPELQMEFEQNFPAELRNHSASNRLMGGEFLFEQMNMIERFIIRRITGVKETTSKLRLGEIDVLVDDLKAAMNKVYSGAD